VEPQQRPEPGPRQQITEAMARGADREGRASSDDYAQGWYDTGWSRGDWSWHGPKEK
jgi:hypothetical protein